MSELANAGGLRSYLAGLSDSLPRAPAAPRDSLGTPAALHDSPGVHWASSKYARVDLTPTLTASDRAALARLLNPDPHKPAQSLLSTLTAGEYRGSEQPDYVAVRTGPSVTSQFSGGGETTSWTNGTTGTVVHYFGEGTPPSALKGVAITFGPNATPEDRENETRIAVGWVSDHQNDHKLSDGTWNRPLIDVEL